MWSGCGPGCGTCRLIRCMRRGFGVIGLGLDYEMRTWAHILHLGLHGWLYCQGYQDENDEYKLFELS